MRESAAVLDAVESSTNNAMPALHRPYETLGWTILGSGIAAGLGGFIMTFQALDTHDELGRLSVTPTSDPSGSQQQWNALQADLESQEMTSWILYGAGASLLGAGIGLLLIEENEDSLDETATVPLFLGNGVRWVF